MSHISQPRRSFLASASVAVAASLPGCSMMSPAAASIIKAAPYVPGGDPLAELIAEYRAQVTCFSARAKDEDWDTLLAATYGPPLERLWHNPPEPTTEAGVAAGIRLAMAEPELYAVPQILAACLRHLERGNAS